MNSKLIKGSKEWFEAKKAARADLDLRLSLGLPHNDKPLGRTERAIASASPAEAARAGAAAPKPRAPRKKKVPTESK